MTEIIATILGVAGSVYAGGFCEVSRRKWRELGGRRALVKGLAWPWCVVRFLTQRGSR